MQNAGQYVPGAASAHPPQQFAPSEPSPNGGSTTSSLRQFRKRDVDKSQLEQPPKQESHVARVAPHNHYPPVSNDLYRYPSHQFSDYSPQVKYSDIADASQPNPISTSVIQKPKSKDFMEMCNVQQQHINNQQQYSPDNGQYMHRDQGYPTGFKPESHYLPKDQHQYQQLAHHPGQSKFNTMITQNMRKYNPGPADNPFLNKLSKIHPSMARSIISDHHLQDPQPTYSTMDQRGMYGQQNHRYYSPSLHQANPYAPNPNYPINPPHHYPNYPSASCSYPRTTTMGPVTPRYSQMERSISPARRGYPENLHMNHLTYHSMPQKMSTAHNFSPQYGGTPEYAQHYQHRRIGQESYLQPCRPTQYMQNHHQIPAQEMQELPESRISPSDSLKKFIENWAADEEPSSEINPMEGNMNLRDNLKVRDDAPPGTVYMINATDVQYFENNGIPIVTSDNGGIQLTSENYQYLLKNGLVDNSGMVRIIEANKEISIDSSGNHERVVNLQIMEAPKSDCMMVNKNLRSNDCSMGPNGMLPKIDDDNRRVVIHQNTIINPGNCIVSERIPPGQQPVDHPSLHETVVENISISKELVDKNCSPINLDQLEHNLGFSEPDPSETERDTNKNSSRPSSALDSNVSDNNNTSNVKYNEINSSDDLSQNSDDSQNKSPGSKSMPIIDLFGDTHIEEIESHDSDSQADTNIFTSDENNMISTDQNSGKQNRKGQISVNNEKSCKEYVEISTKQKEKDCNAIQVKCENKEEASHDCSLDLAASRPKEKHNKSNLELTAPANSVIVTPDTKRKDSVSDDKKCLENAGKSSESLNSCKAINKEDDNRNTSRSLNTVKGEEVLDGSSKYTEDEKTESVSETIDSKSKTKPLNESAISSEILAPIERRKRIFSVDNIIHHIGNNMKRGLRELDLFGTAESSVNFIEKEIGFSSLEQVLVIDHLKNRPRTIMRHKEDLCLNNLNLHEPVMLNSENADNSENVLSAQHSSIQENTINSERGELNAEAELEVEHPKNISTNESPNEASETEEKEVIKNEESGNKAINQEVQSTKDFIKAQSDPVTLPLLLEPNERSNTPSDFQYRNAVRVEETSVLLQIAGELMEISVNIVNGKKVITVVPLSDTTVVDYNDNYEVSANVQGVEAMQMDDSGIELDKTEVTEDVKENNKGNVDNPNHINIQNCTLLEEPQKGNIAVPDEAGENKKDNTEKILETSEKYVKQVGSILDSEVNERGVPFRENKVDHQEQHSKFISSEISEIININDATLDESNLIQATEFQSDLVGDNAQVDYVEDSANTQALTNVFQVDNIELLPETAKIENPEIIETIVISEGIEAAEIVDDFFAAEVVEPNEDLRVVEIYESSATPEIITVPETFEITTDPESLEIITDPVSVQTLKPMEAAIILETSEDKETINKTAYAEATENLAATSQYSVVEINSGNDEILQHDKKAIDNADVLQNYILEKDITDSEAVECGEKILRIDKSSESSSGENEQFISKESIIGNTEADEHDDTDIGTESLECQLEDDVFVLEEPHEIIVNDPLEGVGLIEEVDKTSDSFDISLEPVTTTNEVKETTQSSFAKRIEIDKNEQIISKPNVNPLNETVDILPNKSTNQDPKKAIALFAIEDNILNILAADLIEKADKLRPDETKIKETPAINPEKTNKELLVKITKSEVQILSPTSTNIEDHVVTSKENVYLEPRRKLSSNDDISESTSITITTKAAKKLYECDLQIPAVTTSGDVSTKVSKKSIKYQHDTVSSSKKERVLKEPKRNKKSTIKRSKRINEKIKIKNEQREMLRLLAEKRKQRLESKQREAVKQKPDGDHAERNIEEQVNVDKPSQVEKIKEAKPKNSTENDEEYVDFKELLRARKLKKLKKIQEMKRREPRESKVKTEDTNKNVDKDIKNTTSDKKVIKLYKSALVSSSYAQDKKSDQPSECCIGCNNATRRFEQQKNKKRRKSSDAKGNEETQEIKNQKIIIPASEVVDVKTKITTAIPIEIKPTTVAAVLAKIEVIENQTDIATDKRIETKATSVPEATTITEAANFEAKGVPSSPNVETIKVENHTSKRVKGIPQKRFSLSDDIPSSTSSNETFVLSVTEDVGKAFKTRAQPSSTPKDPRRRSKSYAGPVMVPSVSELIEENSGTVSKKKISLADYVSRKRKTSTGSNGNPKSEEKESMEKRLKLDSAHEKRKYQELLPYKSKEGTKNIKKTIKDVATSFVIHSSDWEDSQSPIPTTIQSNDECLINDFSGLIKNNPKRPVIDVNELTPLENLENPKDKKLQEYKDKVDSQLNSLNIQIPKLKSQSLENKSGKLILGPNGSPESRSLVRKFLNNEKMTQGEMEKIRKIISYKRLIQHQKSARSPSKSPGSASSSYSQGPACSGYETTCLVTGRSPVSSGSTYSESSSDPTYEIKNHMRLEAHSREMRLHLKKVNAKRKLQLEYDDEGSSSAEIRHKKNVDYSVINRLGKDGLPKIIFKRNRQSNISDDNQLVVELERIDDNLEKVEEKYNVTVTQMM